MAYPQERYRSSSLWDETKAAFKHAVIHVGAEAGVAAFQEGKNQYSQNLEQIRVECPAPEQISPLRQEAIKASEGKLGVARARLAHLRAQLTHETGTRIEAVRQVRGRDVVKAGAEAVRDASKKEVLNIIKAGATDIKNGRNTSNPLSA